MGAPVLINGTRYKWSGKQEEEPSRGKEETQEEDDGGGPMRGPRANRARLPARSKEMKPQSPPN